MRVGRYGWLLGAALAAAAAGGFGTSPARAVDVEHRVATDGEGEFTPGAGLFGGLSITRGTLDPSWLGGRVTMYGDLEYREDTPTGGARYAGTLVLAGSRGDGLYLQVPAFDFDSPYDYFQTGAFTAVVQVTGGAGRFEGATGELRLVGSSSLDDEFHLPFVLDELSGTVVLSVP